MKLILFLIGVGLCGTASAQNTPPMHKKVTPYTNKKVIPSKPSIQNTPVYNATPLMILPNGNRVVALPQDNMPCIVPDMKQFSMPNATPVYPNKQKGPGAIPNPISNSNVTTISYIVPAKEK